MVTTATTLCLLLGACASPVELDSWARRNDWSRDSEQAGRFTLATLASPSSPGEDSLHVYLAGDGRPWRRDRPAEDPTGKVDLVLALMARDPAPALYLSRPCYHLPELPPACTPGLWTSDRYSEPVVAAMQQAVAGIIQDRGVRHLTLIGHSGGGVLAVLLAPRLEELAEVQVLTVAANLDTDAWTGFHGHLPLTGSLNPARQPGPRKPPVHWHGAQDQVVPPATLAGYIDRHPQAVFHWVEEYDHRCCWEQLWPQVLAGLPEP